MPTYTVKPGDCLSSIAYAHGHFWETIWSAPENAELKKQRENPDVLCPGDKVFVPEKEAGEESCATEQKHRFELKGVPVFVRLTLLDEGKPRAHEAYRLVVDGGAPIKGVTDGDGYFEQSIPPDAMEVRLILRDGQEEYFLDLGHLDPVDQVAGGQARLRALGYSCGSINDVMNEQTKSAIQAFQKDQGLTVDGTFNPETQGALKREYGS